MIKNNIIVAYEPFGQLEPKIPTNNFQKQQRTLKNFNKIFKKSPAVLYGGSVDDKNIDMLKEIKEIDGFLIGGASKSSKNLLI